MNYYGARQRENDKKWDFTCHNKRTGTRPVGKCADMACKHDTEQEAQECYRQWLLDIKLDIEGQEFGKPWLECEVEGCDHDTNVRVKAGQYHSWILCQTHRTKEVVASMLKVHSFMGSY